MLRHSQFGWTVGVYTYTMDAAGNRIQAVEALQAPNTPPGALPPTTITYTYTYDALYRLTAADDSDGQFFQYTYDAAGNRTQEATLAATTDITYDIASRLTNFGATAYSWDDNGNLLNNGNGDFSYDAANRFVAINTSVQTFEYDGLGNRLRQNAGGTITYTLDAVGGLTQVVVEATDTEQKLYLYGLERIHQQTSVSTDYFLPDGLGSVRQLADASGEVTLSRDYEPYGKALDSAGTGSSRFNFAGEYRDPSGFFYLRARYYSATQGRFTSQDQWPSVYMRPISLNRWLYSLSNPVNYTDPSGMVPCTENQPARFCRLNNGGLIDYHHFNGSRGLSGDLIVALKNQYGERFGIVSLGQPFLGESVPLRYSGTYYTSLPSDGLQKETLRSVAFGIFLDFQMGYEYFQGLDLRCWHPVYKHLIPGHCSSFSNEDLPSDYLGFLSASRFVIDNTSLDFDMIVGTLGGGEQTDMGPGHELASYNDQCTLRVYDPGASSYVNLSWPSDWVITPAGRGVYWARNRAEFVGPAPTPPRPAPAPQLTPRP